MGRHEVTISIDITLARVTTHKAVFVPPPPPPTPLNEIWPHGEVPAFIAHPGGMGTVHKLTSNVYHRNLTIAQNGHDCGFMIGHLCYPPHNAMLPAHSALSSRKTTFGASTVKMNKIATAVIDLLGGCPMILCADPIGSPTEWAPTNFINTVYVGTTWADIVDGWLAAAGSMALDGAFSRIPIDKLFKGFKDGVADSIAKLIETVSKYLIDQGVAGITSSLGPDGSEGKRSHTTPSPFGPANIVVADASDGSFVATTSSPRSDGSTRSNDHRDVGVFGPASEERRAHPLVPALANAPLL